MGPWGNGPNLNRTARESASRRFQLVEVDKRRQLTAAASGKKGGRSRVTVLVLEAKLEAEAGMVALLPRCLHPPNTVIPGGHAGQPAPAWRPCSECGHAYLRIAGGRGRERSGIWTLTKTAGQANKPPLWLAGPSSRSGLIWPGLVWSGLAFGLPSELSPAQVSALTLFGPWRLKPRFSSLELGIVAISLSSSKCNCKVRHPVRPRQPTSRF